MSLSVKSSITVVCMCAVVRSCPISTTPLNTTAHCGLHIILIFIQLTLDLKTSLKSLGIFVATANNTLYGSKLAIFLLCQKSLGY